MLDPAQGRVTEVLGGPAPPRGAAGTAGQERRPRSSDGDKAKAKDHDDTTKGWST